MSNQYKQPWDTWHSKCWWILKSNGFGFYAYAGYSLKEWGFEVFWRTAGDGDWKFNFRFLCFWSSIEYFRPNQTF